MDKQHSPRTGKKVLVAVSVAMVAIILVVSGIMLVSNARLRQAPQQKATAMATPELKVVPSDENVLSATSDTNASSALQGAASTAQPSSNALPGQSAPVTVKPLPAVQNRVCDQAKRLQLLDTYSLKKKEEDAYHSKLLSFLGLESILMQSSETTRHNNVIALLDTTLKNNLSAIYCA
jgi:hypothetical protein